MTGTHSIFFNEWQSCLRAHYIYVLRISDTITEPTLRQVLLQTGLTDADLDAIHQEALALGPLDPHAALDVGSEADAAEPADAPAAEAADPAEVPSGDDEEDSLADEDDDFGPPDLDGQLTML